MIQYLETSWIVLCINNDNLDLELRMCLHRVLFGDRSILWE